jgi:predicted Zn-dependent peptidase
MTEYLPYVQSAAVGVWTLAGAVDENPAVTGDEANSPVGAPAGISHLIEHMLFKGTESRSAKDIAEEVDRTGGAINAFTGKEATCYYIKTLSEHLGESMDLLGDIFLNSIFDEAELTKEKNVIYEEMNMIEDSPEDLGHDLLDEAIFAGSPLGNRIIGYRDTVGGADSSAILAYRKERYVSGNIVISVAGNFLIDEVVERSESAFGRTPAGWLGRRPSKSAHTPSFVSRSKDIEQSHILLGRRGVSLTSRDYYTFILFNSILGGSMSSRLFQSIREEKGLAYSVYSMCNSFVDTGVFMMYAGISEGNERVTIEAIREETGQLATGGVGADELTKVKEQIKGAYVFGRENVQTRMFAMGKHELLLGRVFEPEEVIAGIDAVTPGDIARIAEECADLAGYSAVIIGKNELTKDAVGL